MAGRTITQKPWILVLTVGLGTLLNPLNSSMISVAVTPLQHDFRLSFAVASWMISIFYIASAVGQPVMGKLSDMFGPKRLFMSGLVLVAAASVLAPFSPNFGWLLVFRTLQALGSSTLFPCGLTLIRTSISEGQAKALAALSVFALTSAAFGPSIGGFLIEYWDWQAIFLVNFPFIVISFLLAIFVLPNTGKGKIRLGRIDWGGILLFVSGIVTFILFLLSLDNEIRWWALFICAASFVAFAYYENKRKEPFIDVKALKSNKKVTMVYVQFTFINLVFYSYFFGLPTYFQQVRGYSEGVTGVIMLAMAGFGIVIAPLAGPWIDRQGFKPALLLGTLLLTLGTLLLLTIQQSSPLWWMLIIMAVLGISNSLNNISMQTSLYELVNPEDTGSAAGLFQTSRCVGSILSSSLLGLAFDQHLDLAHLHLVAVVCLITSALVVFLAFRLSGKRPASKLSNQH